MNCILHLKKKLRGNLCFFLRRKNNDYITRVLTVTVFISFQGFLDLILALRFLEMDE